MISRLILFIACISVAWSSVLCACDKKPADYIVAKTCDAIKGCVPEYVAHVKGKTADKPNVIDSSMFEWTTLAGCTDLLKAIDDSVLEAIGDRIPAGTLTALAFPPTEDVKKAINVKVVPYLIKVASLKKIMSEKYKVDAAKAAVDTLTWEQERFSPVYNNSALVEAFKKDIKNAAPATGGNQYKASLDLHSAGKMLDKGYQIEATDGKEVVIKKISPKAGETKTEEPVKDVLDATKKTSFGVTSYPSSSNVGLYLGIAIGVILLIVIIIIVIVVIKRRRSQV